jgi:hypothetical protein
LVAILKIHEKRRKFTIFTQKCTETLKKYAFFIQTLLLQKHWTILNSGRHLEFWLPCWKIVKNCCYCRKLNLNPTITYIFYMFVTSASKLNYFKTSPPSWIFAAILKIMKTLWKLYNFTRWWSQTLTNYEYTLGVCKEHFLKRKSYYTHTHTHTHTIPKKKSFQMIPHTT